MRNVTDRNIKDIFLQYGFKEKPQADGAYNLNPYVFDAARALLEFANAAPVPPAGDVEVLAWVDRDGDFYKERCYPDMKAVILLSDHRAMVTRLTAELDQAEHMRKFWAASAATLSDQVDTLQSELTKARELLAQCSQTFDACTGMTKQSARVDWYADHLEPSKTAVREYLATPIAHNVDESCGQDAEAARLNQMSERIPCSQLDPENNICLSGFPATHAVCWGGSLGCPTCESSVSSPMCMKENLPAHLTRDDGLPLNWPEVKS